MNKQEIFDKVVESLVKQGEPAIEIGKYLTTSCVYRNAEGQRCAVGWLLNDEELAVIDSRPKNVGSSINTIVSYPSLAKKLRPFFYEERGFLSELQRAHDSPALATKRGQHWLKEWRRNMEGVAEVYGLSSESLTRAFDPTQSSTC